MRKNSGSDFDDFAENVASSRDDRQRGGYITKPIFTDYKVGQIQRNNSSTNKNKNVDMSEDLDSDFQISGISSDQPAKAVIDMNIKSFQKDFSPNESTNQRKQSEFPNKEILPFKLPKVNIQISQTKDNPFVEKQTDLVNSDDLSVDLSQLSAQKKEWKEKQRQVISRITKLMHPDLQKESDQHALKNMIRQQNKLKKKEEKVKCCQKRPSSVFKIPQTGLLTYLSLLLSMIPPLKPFCEKYLPCQKLDDEPTLLDKRSLFIFKSKNKLRVMIAEFVLSKAFEQLTLIVILVNSLFLLVYDFNDPDNLTAHNQRIETANMIFGVFYCVECVLKILSQGFILHQNSYLKDYWNWIDFVVVVFWIFELTLKEAGNIKSLRSIRVIRPLRSIKIWKAMQKIVQGLIFALPALANALLFMIFVFLQFAIFATIQFGGAYYSVCRLTKEPLENGEWPVDFDNFRVCNVNLNNCDEGRYCGQQEFDLTNVEELDYGFTTFNNIYYSLITVFQCITLEGWSKIMFDLGRSQQYPIIAYLFFVFLILVGSLLLIQVILAIFEDSFGNIKEQQQIRLDKQDEKNLKELEKLKQKTELKKIKIGQQLKEKLERAKLKIAFQSSSQSQNFAEAARSLKEMKRSKSEDATQVAQKKQKQAKNEQLDLKKLTTRRQMYEIEEKQINNAIEKFSLKIKSKKDQEESEGDFSPTNKKSLSPRSKNMQERVLKHQIFRWSYQISMHPLFNIFISLLIIANCIILAQDRYNISEKEVNTNDNINLVFSLIFFIEMIIKLLGLGIRQYASDSLNLLDALIVCISMVEIILIFTTRSQSSTTFTVLRTLRVLRIFKLSTKLKTFNEILTRVSSTVKDIFTFFCLLIIMEFVFIVLGMQFFANSVYTDENGLLTDAEHGEAPGLNFDTITRAFVTVFIVFIGDDWPGLMFTYRRNQSFFALFYFNALIITANMILLNLFLAILLSEFDKPLDQTSDEDNQEQGELQIFIQKHTQSFLACIKRVCVPNCLKKQKSNEIQNPQTIEDDMHHSSDEIPVEFQDPNIMIRKRKSSKTKLTKKKSLKVSLHDLKILDTIRKSQKLNLLPLEGRSFNIFGVDSQLRNNLHKIFTYKYYGHCACVLILYASINLILMNPLDDPNSSSSKLYGYIDLSLTILFLLEILLKSIVWGFALNGPRSYIRDPWNQVDFFVTLMALLANLQVGSEQAQDVIRALSVLRALRPLKIIIRYERFNLEVLSLIGSIPSVMNLIVISLLVMIVFAIVGVSFYKGKLYSCKMDDIPEDLHSNIQNYWQCLDYGGVWINSDNNFDNVISSLKTQFIIMCAEGWIGIYENLRDCTSYYEMNVEDKNPLSLVYMVITILTCSLFLLNMFVGVVINTFKIEKEKITHQTLLTDNEKEFIEACQQVYQMQPEKKISPKENKFQYNMYQIAEDKRFYNIIILCIVLNSLILMLIWYGQAEEVSKTLSWLNHGISFIFTFEAIVKISAYGANYFYDPWNIADFLICIVSWVDLILELAAAADVNPALRIIRTFRVARLIKLIRNLEKLNQIMMTFVKSIPALINVGCLLSLFLYLYAVMGVYFFSGIKLQEFLNEDFNFQTFGNAFLTLFVLLTGENWCFVMEDCARTRSAAFECIEHQNYEDLQVHGIQGCGSPFLAYSYFISFQILMTFTMLNLFIAIILEAFGQQQDENRLLVQPETYVIFQKIWKKDNYDPDATGLIEFDKIFEFIMELVDIEITKEKESLVHAPNPLFKFSKESLFYLYYMWKYADKSKLSQEYREQVVEKIDQDKILSNELERGLKVFVARLQLPLFKGAKPNQSYVSFHDVLYSFVKYVHNKRHQNNVYQRKIRKFKYEQDKKNAKYLHPFDLINVGSEEYKALSKIDKQVYHEQRARDFDYTIQQIEKKVDYPQKIKAIHDLIKLRADIHVIHVKNHMEFNNLGFHSGHAYSAKLIIAKMRILTQRRRNEQAQEQLERVKQLTNLLSPSQKAQKTQGQQPEANPLMRKACWKPRDFDIRFGFENKISEVLRNNMKLNKFFTKPDLKDGEENVDIYQQELVKKQEPNSPLQLVGKVKSNLLVDVTDKPNQDKVDQAERIQTNDHLLTENERINVEKTLQKSIDQVPKYSSQVNKVSKKMLKNPQSNSSDKTKPQQETLQSLLNGGKLITPAVYQKL